MIRNYKIPILNIKQFSDKEFCPYSLSARDYRKLSTKNNNLKRLVDLISKKHKVGREIGSENYMPKSKYRFLKTVNISRNYLLDESSIEYCKPENKVFPKKNEILIVKDGGGAGLGEVCLYPYENKGNLDSLSAGIISIDVREDARFYVLGLLKSQHFKDYIDLNTAQGSTIRHSKIVALDYKIPFPTKNNFSNPDKIQELVSLIVQNIVDKEEQIKLKNQLINELITKELNENQNTKNIFKYSYPRISDITREARLDTGIFERKFQENDFLISNYISGWNNLHSIESKFVSGSTPESYLPSSNKNDYWWIAVADIEYGLLYKKIINIRLPNPINNLLKDGDILITRKGATVGKMNLFFQDIYKKAFVNEDIKVIRLNIPMPNKIFVGMFLNSYYGKTQLLNHGSKGTKQGLTNKNILDVKLPNFSDAKQKEISKEYYNKVDKNHNMVFETYLEKEKQRNKQLGIFQLNMETFTLREKLEEIIDSIINETLVDVKLEY